MGLVLFILVILIFFTVIGMLMSNITFSKSNEEQIIDNLTLELEKHKTRIPTNLKRLIGNKVIIRSNEWDEQYSIAEVYDIRTDAKGSIPIIIKEVYGELREFMVFSLIVKYDEHLIPILDSMTTREQWEFLKKFNYNFN